MNKDNENTHDATLINPQLGLATEIGEAFQSSRRGNSWPLAILEAKAGNPKRLAELIRLKGLRADSPEAATVAYILEGKFKATKRDKGKFHEYEVLSFIGVLNEIRLAIKDHPRNDDLKSLDHVYTMVATQLFMTKDAVEKVVTRNRKRLKGDTDKTDKS